MSKPLLGPIFLAFMTFGTAGLAQAAMDPALEPVVLAPMSHSEATLTVVDLAGVEHVYTPAELEAFATYSLRTAEPWREEPAVFEGILLTDLLARHGLDQVDRLLVIAENDYASEFDRAVWETGAFLVATRVDGAAHTRRNRGPIQFVASMDALEESEAITEQHLVWMAAVIRPAE